MFEWKANFHFQSIKSSWKSKPHDSRIRRADHHSVFSALTLASLAFGFFCFFVFSISCDFLFCPLTKTKRIYARWIHVEYEHRAIAHVTLSILKYILYIYMCVKCAESWNGGWRVVAVATATPTASSVATTRLTTALHTLHTIQFISFLSCTQTYAFVIRSLCGSDLIYYIWARSLVQSLVRATISNTYKCMFRDGSFCVATSHTLHTHTHRLQKQIQRHTIQFQNWKWKNTHTQCTAIKIKL